MKFRSKSIKKKSAYDEKYLWPIFSLYIRFRDSDNEGNGSCFTCGLHRHYSEADCGHGIPRQHKSTKYSEINNSLQCKKCNGFEAGARDVYAKKVDEKYGSGTWDKLTVQSKQVCKRDKFEYDIMTDYYLGELKKLAELKDIDVLQLPAVKRWANRKDK